MTILIMEKFLIKMITVVKINDKKDNRNGNNII